MSVPLRLISRFGLAHLHQHTTSPATAPASAPAFSFANVSPLGPNRALTPAPGHAPFSSLSHIPDLTLTSSPTPDGIASRGPASEIAPVPSTAPAPALAVATTNAVVLVVLALSNATLTRFSFPAPPCPCTYTCTCTYTCPWTCMRQSTFTCTCTCTCICNCTFIKNRLCPCLGTNPALRFATLALACFYPTDFPFLPSLPRSRLCS